MELREVATINKVLFYAKNQLHAPSVSLAFASQWCRYTQPPANRGDPCGIAGSCRSDSCKRQDACETFSYNACPISLLKASNAWHFPQRAVSICAIAGNLHFCRQK